MSNELTTLSTLAVEIDALDEQARIYANQALIYAAKSGQKLLLAKAQCNHGQFKQWLDENCKIPYATAQRYMRLAKECPQFLNSNLATSPILPSISQMIELMSAPEEVKTEVTAKIEAGEDVTVKEIQRLKKEAAEAKQQTEALQNDLLNAQQSATNYRIMFNESNKKCNELRDNQQQIIDARVNEEKAKMILENQEAIAQVKRERDNAKNDIEKLKKERDQQIELGVKRGLQEMDTEIAKKQYQIDSYNRDIEKLREIENGLEREVGFLQTHKEAIKEIKENLSHLTVSFHDAFETNCIPDEVFNEWQSISYAVKKLNSQMLEFIANHSPIHSHAIEGELV